MDIFERELSGGQGFAIEEGGFVGGGHVRRIA